MNVMEGSANPLSEEKMLLQGGWMWLEAAFCVVLQALDKAQQGRFLVNSRDLLTAVRQDHVRDDFLPESPVSPMHPWGAGPWGGAQTLSSLSLGEPCALLSRTDPRRRLAPSSV